MSRTDDAITIRSWRWGDYGVRFALHDEYESRFDYSSHPASSPFNGGTGAAVWHHHGKSAQLPRIAANIAAGMTVLEADLVQANYVDKIHFVDNGWAHGFAYLLGIMSGFGHEDGEPVTVVEGRSAWYPHGAHLNDPAKLDFPIYVAVGAAEAGLSFGQRQAIHAVNMMRQEVFGWAPTEANQLKHRERQPDTTCCDPVLGAFVEQMRSSGWPALLRRGDSHPAVRLTRGLLYLVDQMENAFGGWIDERFTVAVDRGVRSFQAWRGITVDGIIGPQTRAELYAAANETQ